MRKKCTIKARDQTPPPSLAAYIAEKYQPSRRERDLDTIRVADVLSIYFDDRRALVSNQKAFDERIERLNRFWGNRTLAEVTGATCRQYADWQGSRGGARRDLEDLRAAINHHAKEGLHRGVVGVVLPPRGAPRDRWLTRSEAARLIWTCWRAREVQTLHRGRAKGEKAETDKRPLRHIARFILALYTGRRAGAVASASPVRAPGRSFIDLEDGVFYRLAEGQRATNKRQPPVPIPPRLLAHLRRWNAKPVQSVKTGFATAVRKAGLDGKVTPHTLRLRPG